MLALLAWQLSTLWTAYPDYLPTSTRRCRTRSAVLVDSDLDWARICAAWSCVLRSCGFRSCASHTAARRT